MSETRKIIGYVEAVVRFNLREGDVWADDTKWPWFEYSEPGITHGQLGCCTRQCKTLSSKVVLERSADE